MLYVWEIIGQLVANPSAANFSNCISAIFSQSTIAMCNLRWLFPFWQQFLLGPLGDGSPDARVDQHGLVRDGQDGQDVLDDELEVEVTQGLQAQLGHPPVHDFEAVVVEEEASAGLLRSQEEVGQGQPAGQVVGPHHQPAQLNRVALGSNPSGFEALNLLFVLLTLKEKMRKTFFRDIL